MSLRILALDTSTEACTVALLREDEVIERHEEAGRDAALRILPLIDSVLAEAGCQLSELTVLAAGIGPGGFTGVRLGVAVAQGLAFGAALAVVPVNTLEALAWPALRRAGQHGAPSIASGHAGGAGAVLACLDARMGGIYWGCYRADAAWGVAPLEGPALGTPAELEPRLRAQALSAVGPGMRLLQATGPWPAPCDAQALPHAADLARLAALRLPHGAAVDPAELMPLYLRDRVALTEAERGGLSQKRHM